LLIAVTALATLAVVAIPRRGKAEDKAAAIPRAGRGDAFRPMDVFQLEYASDPQISPDGLRIVYVRNSMDVMKDRRLSNLWTINIDGAEHRPLTTGKQNDFSPRWSPDGKRMVYLSTAGGSPQLYCRWMDTGQVAKLTDGTSTPSNPVWSPDGKLVTFTMAVADAASPFVELPAKPEGAEWAPSPNVIRKVIYRADGAGYLKDEHSQIFVVPADGGAPRQLTEGPYDHASPPIWSPDAKALIFAANRHSNCELDPLDTEIYELSLQHRTVKALTDHKGPDDEPALSADGKRIAFVSFDDQRKGYQSNSLYVMNRDGTGRRQLTPKLDREIHRPAWGKDSVYFQYDDRGTTRIGLAPLEGEVDPQAADLGGELIDRPYSGGSFTVASDGTLAFTLCSASRPADVGVRSRTSAKTQRLTNLNESLLGDRTLGAVEEIEFESSHDRRKIQGWVVKPPHFDEKKKYPLILEIHGGPYANYGDRFSAEMQLYAAAGYVVLYINPRGSTGYGEEFAQLINNKYPGNDYDDLMTAVDSVLKRGYVDANNLFVTGGSGGGVLTAWIVGKTARFRAAVSCKPVINWYSHALTADEYPLFTQYWFTGPPWEHAEEYMKRSPISLVGNVTTPTMLLTGEEDYRTPIAESEQFYQALKLRKVDTALVRIPGSSHNIGARPSQIISKVACILKWFETHKQQAEAGDGNPKERDSRNALAEQLVKADQERVSQDAPPTVAAISDRLRKDIAVKEIAGAVTLVATPDRILHLDATGDAGLNPAEKMRTDSIFWIASMSKPVLGTLLLMLQDEGLLSVDDPVEKYLPEFKELKTADGKPAKVTIRHLLTHTSGMGEISGEKARACKTLADVIPLYVAKPVAFTPGSKCAYCQSGINTGGRIAEVVTGEPLEKLLKKRLFDPLGMKDTTFYLTEQQLPRLAKSYRRTDKGDLAESDIGFLNGKSPTSLDRFPAPNGGLFSTASDYARFCQMVLRGGELDGKRFLKPESVKLMTTIQTGDLKTGFTDGNGWGLGWCVVRQPQGITGMFAPGAFGHGGAYGTQAWIDPGTKRIYILMVQRANFPNSDASDVRRGFQETADAALSHVKRNIPYADAPNVRQVVDVYSPKDAKNLPVVFWIHGGGWQTGDKTDVQIKPQVFMDKGFVFVSTNYRLLPDVDMATLVRDVAKSIHWVHDHIAEYGGDPNRLLIMGHSAGAQLSALMCTDDRYLKAEGLSLAIVKGCVPVDGDTFDVPAIIESGETRRRVHSLPQPKFGHREKFGNDPEKHRDFSAVTHVAKDKGIPPFLILHVAEHPDTSAQAQRLGNVLKDSGVPVTVFGARETTHSKINADLGLPDDPATRALFEFLGKALKQ
jgi:acylaminoacyl-peptidase